MAGPKSQSSLLTESIESYSSSRLSRLKIIYPDLDEQNHPLPSCLLRRVSVFGVVDPHPDCEFVDESHLHARFKPKTKTQNSAELVSIQTDFPLQPFYKYFYFEACVVEAPRDKDVAIGISERFSHDKCLPGVQMDSYGYNQNGSIYQGAKILVRAEPYRVGDIVGCGADFVKQQIFFTKNGQHMKTISADLPIDYPLVPVIGFSFFGQMRANFGQFDFIYDVKEEFKRRDATNPAHSFHKLSFVRLPAAPVLSTAQSACQADNWARLYKDIPSSLLANCLDPLQRRRLLSISADNLNVTYIGLAKPDFDAAAILANRQMPDSLTCPFYYFEVKILNKGSRGKIAIGLAFTGQHLGVMLGWQESSVAYHGDDGRSFGNCNIGLKYGPKFDTGDVIGCAVDNTNQHVFYTHNGKRIPGVAFDNFLNEGSIYPAISILDKNASVHLNFGQEEWAWKDVFKEAQKARRRSLKSGIKRSLSLVTEEVLCAAREHILSTATEEILCTAPEDPTHPPVPSSPFPLSDSKEGLKTSSLSEVDVSGSPHLETQKRRAYCLKELIPTPKKQKLIKEKVECQHPLEANTSSSGNSLAVPPVTTPPFPPTSFCSYIKRQDRKDAACNTSGQSDETVWRIETGCQTYQEDVQDCSLFKRNEVISKCHHVTQLIKEGKVKPVIKVLEDHFHGIFEVHRELKLWLRLQQFVENILPVMKVHINHQKVLEKGLTIDAIDQREAIMTSSQLRKKGKALHEEVRIFLKKDRTHTNAGLKKKLESALLLTFESNQEKISASEVLSQAERDRLAMAVQFALFQHTGMTASMDMF